MLLINYIVQIWEVSKTKGVVADKVLIQCICMGSPNFLWDPLQKTHEVAPILGDPPTTEETLALSYDG